MTPEYLDTFTRAAVDHRCQRQYDTCREQERAGRCTMKYAGKDLDGRDVWFVWGRDP